MPGRPIDNERRACDAVVRAIESLAGSVRRKAFSPEDEGSNAPVEYVFELDHRRYAIEHTIVEAFDGQIHTGVDFGSFIGPVVEALNYHMPPPGRFDLLFNIHPSKGLKPRDIPRVQASIIQWVREKATELHDECPQQPLRNHRPGGVRNSRRATVAGVEVTLNRETIWSQPATVHGRLFTTRFAPKDYEILRSERLKKAMDKKLPKLKAWKDDGARSVLVLENCDMSLSNHGVILNAAEDALLGRSDQPDELWLVDTTIEKEWTVWCLISDGVPFPYEETSFRYWDFNPAELQAV